MIVPLTGWLFNVNFDSFNQLKSSSQFEMKSDNETIVDVKKTGFAFASICSYETAVRQTISLTL